MPRSTRAPGTPCGAPRTDATPVEWSLASPPAFHQARWALWTDCNLPGGRCWRPSAQGDDMASIRTRPVSFLFAVVALVGLMLAGLVDVAASAPAQAASGVVVVHSGGSIQDALDNARPGSTVVVEAGTY